MHTDHKREFHGGVYRITPSDRDRHAGDPQVLAWGAPGYRHPQPLDRDVLDPGGPRVLPVSQQVQHGSERSREEEFEQALRQDAAALHAFHSLNVFNDRRVEGRRYRETDFVEDILGSANIPYNNRGWQRDAVPFDRYQSVLPVSSMRRF